MKEKDEHYFSLLELLLVIATVILLTSLTAAPLHRAKMLALQTACANNLRQIGTAMQLYRKDHDELPVSYHFLDDFRPVYPYIRSLDVFVCPGNPYSVKRVPDYESLERKTDYLFYPGKLVLTDNEKNGKTNNGNGNNIFPHDIYLDPSNPNFENKFLRLYGEKIGYPAIYDRCGPAHFKGINICFLDNGEVRTESRPDMCNLWTLDEKGSLYTNPAALFPPLPER